MTPPQCKYYAYGGSKPPPYDFAVGADAHNGPRAIRESPLRNASVGRGILDAPKGPLV